jgi:hypothetical protein
MKPTLQPESKCSQLLITPAGLLGGHPGLAVPSRLPFTPSISWADPALACAFDLSAFVVAAIRFRPTSSAPGHVSHQRQRLPSRRPGKVSDFQPRMLGVPFQPQPQRHLVPFCIDCCGDELAMAKDMPFLFLSLSFAVISARSGCERQGPRTSTAGGLGRDEGTATIPESLPYSLFGRCRSDDGPPPSKPGSHMPYASSNCLLGILDEGGIHAPLFARTAGRSRAPPRQPCRT